MTSDNGELARYFDRCAEKGIMCSFEESEVAKVGRLLADWRISPGMRVVEPGCGSGRLTERIAGLAGDGGRVLAFDISPVMIAKALERGLPAQAEFAVADAASIPAADSSFDLAVCFHVFPHFADRSAALAELARVLAPGGRLCIDHLRGSREINEFHRGASPEVAGHLIPPEAEMRATLAGAGFAVASFVDTPDGYHLRAVKG